MSQTSGTVSGTQFPPVMDNEPMGASSIRGGNAGGIPDREQRSSLWSLRFDCAHACSRQSSHDGTDTIAFATLSICAQAAPTASDAVRNLPNVLPGKYHRNVHPIETAPTASDAVRDAFSEESKSAKHSSKKQPVNLFESAPTPSDAVRNLNKHDMRSVMHT
ncbi:hypothetical protein EW146_g1998 [Bondarzewia mesenterica]|uniref:Uncharacterized protein n=1 Tax=Bondarzewia mesenterica TaxID=1095465 RepID=A0A4S4M223_9AGAM|nr:hypothetical protein EW146_g1998 [Bondarzewia mesenterica]